MFEEVFLAALAFGFLLFLLPVFIAFRRRHPNRWPILIITVVFGATLFGWLIALVWALDWEDLRDRHGLEDDEDEFDEDDEDRDDVHWHRSRPLTAVGEQMVEAVPDSALPARHDDANGAEQIERLVHLRQQGHIDGNEFDALKAAVLNRVRRA